ncbi:XRE family transcriptional regulator [Streptomyces kunmingensis]|uniref:XRE family transcriptional regulator n=1 Tax=Streptomyces kunmingensis TaxID=68225 RepID=A0ABU6CQC7_9ACTN|nr:XRE family transcriptional regulator [Streptomyces kunmingensis]MEB3966867.1 XRE family transcriptional regulator [Streptomyces kunmingensis]
MDDLTSGGRTHVVPGLSDVQDVSAFVALMRRCKETSGFTYRELELRAAKNGDVLARSTLAGALSREALPKADLLTAFVRACGVSDEEVAQWLAVREELSAGAPLFDADPDAGSGARAESDADGTEVGEPGTPDQGSADGRTTSPRPPRSARSRRRAYLLVAGTVAVVALIVAVALKSGGDGDGSADAVPAGEVSVRPLEGPDLCLTDGKDRAGRYDSLIAVFRPCAKATPPVTELRSTGDGRYRVRWYHPEHGPGCLNAREDGAPKGFLEPFDDCAKGSPLRVERVTDTAATYVLKVSEERCVAAGAKGEVPVVGTEAVVRPCDGSAGQRFVIRSSAAQEDTATAK